MDCVINLEVTKQGPWDGPADPRNPPLLFLHGFPDAPRVFDKVVEHYVGKGRRVARVAWPNYGKQPEVLWGLDFDVLLRALIAATEALGGGPVDVVAHDWGAVFAWLLERARPDLVRRLVAIDVASELPKDWRSVAWTMGYQFPLIIAFLVGGTVGDMIVKAVCGVFDRPRDGGPAKSSMAYFYYYFWKRWGNLGDVCDGPKPPARLPNCPTLYVYSKRKPFQFHHEDWLTRMKRREDCEVIGMDAGHWIFIDGKEEFLQHMDTFFGRCDEKQ